MDSSPLENIKAIYTFDEIEFITDEEEVGDYYLFPKDKIKDVDKITKGYSSKVSNCCGAGYEQWRNEYKCLSCGEPCEAVEEDLEPLSDEEREYYENLPDATKPDPIEPVDDKELRTSDHSPIPSLIDKINEQSEIINYLLQQHE